MVVAYVRMEGAYQILFQFYDDPARTKQSNLLREQSEWQIIESLFRYSYIDKIKHSELFIGLDEGNSANRWWHFKHLK